MRRGFILTIMLLCMSATMRAGGDGMFDPAMILPLNCQSTTTLYQLVDGNRAGFLYFPGESVDLTLTFVHNDAVDTYAIEIQGVHTRKPNKTKQYVDPFGFPDILNLDGNPVRHPVTVNFNGNDVATFVVKDLPVPDRYGTYCLILLTGEGTTKKDRILLGSVARIMKTRNDATVENTPVFGEGQIFHGFKDKAEAARAYYRMGVRGVRCEISWNGDTQTSGYDWTQYDKLTADLKSGGLRAMFTLGGVAGKMRGFSLEKHAVPAAVGPDWNGNYYSGQADWGCAPEYFPLYAEWVKAFSQRYWEGGQGALWGFENFNEPWEGGGISGYARDCVSYREWQRQLAKAAHSVSKDIRICAASSIMNTEDKLYSEGPDANGEYEMDRYIDVFTDHYVTPFNAYGPMVAQKHGKFSIENETWLVISEYLLPQVMCQWMASGQRAVSPWHPKVLFQGVAGVDQNYHCPSTVPVATAAFNHFITGLRFEKLVFQDHLPWLFQFGKDNNPDGVCVLFGQLLTRGGPTPQDNPEGRLWAQVDSVNGGTITIDNRDEALRFYDIGGNRIHEGEKSVTLDMTILPAYIKASGGPEQITRRIEMATISDKYPAEILPHDFTQRITGPDLSLRVKVANRLNRSLKGTLRLDSPDGFEATREQIEIDLDAGENRTVAFTFTKVTESPTNQYPFSFTLESDAGICTYEETLSCCVAVKGAKAIDGNLNDWDGIPAITVVGRDKTISQDELARKPWLRLVEDLPEKAVFAEIKLAWDEDFLYVAGRVKDPTPQTDKVRMEGRDEDAYFHSATSDQEEPWKTWLEQYAEEQSFAQVSHVYKKKPFDNSYTGDQLQLAFNVTDGFHDLSPATDVPYGFHAVPDTDYEFSAYLCLDGKSELWNLLAPGIPRIHDWPRQPKGKVTTNATPGARHVVKQDGNVRIYEVAIPQQAIRELALKSGTTFGFTFMVGNNKGPKIYYGKKKAVTKTNGLTLHPYWATSPSCDIEWALVE